MRAFGTGAGVTWGGETHMHTRALIAIPLVIAAMLPAAQLSARTCWSFAREFSSFWSAQATGGRR